MSSEAGILHDDSDLVVEAEVDAIVKLGMFIGDKIYSTDFASQCPCHPDRRMWYYFLKMLMFTFQNKFVLSSNFTTVSSNPKKYELFRYFMSST